MDELVEARAWRWMGGRDRGLSSEAMWSRMMGAPPESRVANAFTGWNHPHDPSDFGRCERLLNLIPEWRVRLPEMAVLTPEWARLAERWADIQKLYDAEDGLGCYALIAECVHPAKAQP